MISRAPRARSLGRRSGAAVMGSGSCSTAMPRTASDRGSHDLITARSAALASACASALSDTCAPAAGCSAASSFLHSCPMAMLRLHR